jgi:hypothetical protein
MHPAGEIELTLYVDTTTEGSYIELLRYQPETDSFIIRELHETETGDIRPLVSGHSLFRDVVVRRLTTGRLLKSYR